MFLHSEEILFLGRFHIQYLQFSQGDCTFQYNPMNYLCRFLLSGTVHRIGCVHFLPLTQSMEFIVYFSPSNIIHGICCVEILPSNTVHRI